MRDRPKQEEYRNELSIKPDCGSFMIVIINSLGDLGVNENGAVIF